ncbi:hypothetical protein [Phyllobacterium chamaecytisi]|uniref:hypothetical protein n=1 Tax=Phyllobacterium chamaecytisi TaxID=2876082 RepID=UPI001CC9E835|nr:hypothetical protein [Phyllobacterium sp. KW56]MBZ9603315.1 hypothetical protein [Phyllobacterium sp. KW56]
MPTFTLTPGTPAAEGAKDPALEDAPEDGAKQPDATSAYSPQLLLLVMLLLFYCGPVIVVFGFFVYYVFFTQSGLIEGVIVNAIKTVSADPKNYTNTITQMLLPVATALTAVNYRSIFMTSWSAVLFLIPLLAVFACIVNALLFSIATSNIEVPDSEAISQFFLNTAGTLSVYVMMLVGLKMGEAPPKS